MATGRDDEELAALVESVERLLDGFAGRGGCSTGSLGGAAARRVRWEGRLLDGFAGRGGRGGKARAALRLCAVSAVK